MQPEDAVDLFSYLDRAGTIGFLITVLLGGVRQWWVFGHQYREMRADRDQWRMIAMQGHSLSKQAVNALASSVAQQS